MTSFEIIATGTEFTKSFRSYQPVMAEMLKNANKSVHILNYMFGPESEGLWDMLWDILDKQKSVTIVVHRLSAQEAGAKDSLQDLNNEFGRENFKLAEFKMPDRGFLHAKVIVADWSKMIMGSANLSAGGLRDNYEMGVLIEGTESFEVAKVIQQIASNEDLCTIVPPSK
jgi:phosphatidylserine/phosphatidylglycerophosphate/cardiolipin synthase-like enzyme